MTIASFPCDLLIFQASYLPQTSPLGSFINTSVLLMNLKFSPLPPLLLNHFSSPSSTQVSAPSHHLPNPTAGQSWWENGFPEGFELQTGSNSFSPLPFAVFHLPLIQLSAEQRVIAFDERFFFFFIVFSFFFWQQQMLMWLASLQEHHHTWTDRSFARCECLAYLSGLI